MAGVAEQASKPKNSTTTSQVWFDNYNTLSTQFTGRHEELLEISTENAATTRSPQLYNYFAPMSFVGLHPS
jgi:predicted transcriptional regulator